MSQGILAVALDAAGERPVRRVTVRVGALQRVVPDSLEFGFRMLAEGTAAADAVLDVATVPAQVRCRSCGQEGSVDAELICATCGSTDIAIVSGDEVVVEELELDGSSAATIERVDREVVEPEDHHHPPEGWDV